MNNVHHRLSKLIFPLHIHSLLTAFQSTTCTRSNQRWYRCKSPRVDCTRSSVCLLRLGQAPVPCGRISLGCLDVFDSTYCCLGPFPLGLAETSMAGSGEPLTTVLALHYPPLFLRLLQYVTHARIMKTIMRFAFTRFESDITCLLNIFLCFAEVRRRPVGLSSFTTALFIHCCGVLFGVKKKICRSL